MFGKSLFQSEYRIPKTAFEEKLPKETILELFENREEINKRNISPLQLVEEMSKNQIDKSDIECAFFESADDVPDPKDINPQKKNLMVFDDLLFEKQSKCDSSRHSNRNSYSWCRNYFFIAGK